MSISQSETNRLNEFSGKSKEELKKLIRASEDELLKLKKIYKQKLVIQTAGMNSDDISNLRQDLAQIME